MSYWNSLQNTSIDLINGNGPKSPPGSPDPIDGPWLPPLPDSSYEDDPHWQHFFEGTPPPTPTNSDKTDDDDDAENKDGDDDLENEDDDDDAEKENKDDDDDADNKNDDDDDEVSLHPAKKRTLKHNGAQKEAGALKKKRYG